jgi:predicted ATPase
VLQAVKGQQALETGHAYARARELWEQLGSPSEFLHIPYGQSLHHVFRGELDLAQRLDQDLLRLSRESNDSTGLVLGHSSSGRTLMFADGFASSRSHFEEALALYDPILCRSLARHAGPDPRVAVLGYLGIDLFCLGYPHQALVQSSAAIAEARRLADPSSLAASLAISAGLLLLGGDNAALDKRAGQLIAVATEQGFPRWHAQGTICRGWVKVNNGDVAEGMSLLRSGSKAYRATGCRIISPSWPRHARLRDKLKKA